jgi:hypothetical protein
MSYIFTNVALNFSIIGFHSLISKAKANDLEWHKNKDINAFITNTLKPWGSFEKKFSNPHEL